MLRLTFALSHGREAQERLLDRFNQISDPSSPLFRQHLTRAEVTALLRGGDGGEGEAAAAVRRFLVADHGLDPAAVRLAGNEDFVVAHVDAGKAEGILSTGLVSLRDREGRRRRIRSLAPARLPEGVARHVDWIGGVPPPLEEDEGPAATRPGGRDRGRRRRLPEGWAEVPSMASRPPSPGGGLPAPTPVGGGGLHTRRAAGLSAGGPVAAIPQPWRGESPAVMVMVRCPDWAPGRTMDRAGDCGGGIAVTDLTVALDPDQDGGSALSVTIHAQSFPTHCLPCRGFGQGGYLGQGLQYVCQNLLGESLLCEGDSCGDKDRHRDPHRDHAADEEPAEASSLVACFVPLPRQDASLPSSLVGRMSALRTEVHFREPGAPPGAPPRPARGGCFAGARVFECMDRGLVLQPDVTPELLRGLYRVPPDMRGAAADTAPGGGGGSGGQAVIEFLEQSYSPVDLSSFLMENNIRTREPVAELTTVCGGDFFLRNATDGSQIPTQCQNPSDPGSEGTLDLQMLLGMAPGVHTEFWSFGGRRDQNLPASSVNQEPFLDYFVALASHEDPPLVHSVSYDDLDLDVPAAYRERLDLEFAKAGARGISLLFAAGDDGVGGETLRNGEAAAAENGRLCRPFRVGWPASSPYVTSVGGTAFGVAAGGGIGEVAAHSATGSMVTTSGGFSTLYEREDLAPWQARHCEHYLAPASAPGAPPLDRVLPPQELFSHSGRGYPDLSAMATNYHTVYGVRGGQGSYPMGGTSASTPVVAAFVSMLNEERLAKGLAPLGFLNPQLYALADPSGSPSGTSSFCPDCFVDVTEGSNACSAFGDRCCEWGFEASRGWDPVTGLGTPNVQALWRELAGGPGARPGPSAPSEGPPPAGQLALRAVAAMAAIAVVAAAARVWLLRREREKMRRQRDVVRRPSFVPQLPFPLEADLDASHGGAEMATPSKDPSRRFVPLEAILSRVLRPFDRRGPTGYSYNTAESDADGIDVPAIT